MTIERLKKEKYPLKLRAIECIEILREANEKRLKAQVEEINLNCRECGYGACTNSMTDACIENEALTEILSIYEEMLYTLMGHNLINENHRAVKYYQ